LRLKAFLDPKKALDREERKEIRKDRKENRSQI
jgi:hypothetical protein